MTTDDVLLGYRLQLFAEAVRMNERVGGATRSRCTAIVYQCPQMDTR